MGKLRFRRVHGLQPRLAALGNLGIDANGGGQAGCEERKNILGPLRPAEAMTRSIHVLRNFHLVTR